MKMLGAMGGGIKDNDGNNCKGKCKSCRAAKGCKARLMAALLLLWFMVCSVARPLLACAKCLLCLRENKVVPEKPRQPVEVPWLHAAEMADPQNSYIEIVGASGIAKADFLGSSDPYCIVYWNGQKLGRTRESLSAIFEHKVLMLMLLLWLF